MPEARTTVPLTPQWSEHTEQIQDLTNPYPTQKSRRNIVQDSCQMQDSCMK